MKKVIYGISIVLFVTIIGCNNKNTEKDNTPQIEKESIEKETTDYNKLLIGSWVEKNPINENEVQGLEIIKGGEAKSINMATLLYKKWWVENDKLFLVEESLGNQTSSIDTISYKISSIDDKSLILTDGDYTVNYKKQ